MIKFKDKDGYIKFILTDTGDILKMTPDVIKALNDMGVTLEKIQNKETGEIKGVILNGLSQDDIKYIYGDTNE